MLTSSVADDVELATHEIHFFGQKHFDEARLQNEMGVDTASFFQFWKDGTPRLKDKLRPSLHASLKSFYESEGFYDATFKITNTKTTYTVNITENEPIRVKNILIESDHNITHFIKFKKDDIFRTKRFISIKSKIISSLLKEGYCSYDFDTKAYVDLEKHSVDLEYRLSEGGLCTFGKLTTSGLETIDESVVKSRVRALEGEVYSTELIQDTSNNLYGLSAFDSVVIDVNRKFYNVVPVDIQFTELENQYHTEVGVGYDTYVGPKVHAQITKYNFLGQAQQIGLKTSWSSREQLLIANFFKPDLFTLFDRSIDIGGSTGYSNLEFDGFKEEKYFLNAYLEHKDKRLKLRLGVTSEAISIAALDNLGSGQLQQAVNEGDFVLFYPYIDVVYDGRDSKLNPKYGYYLAGYTELGLSKDEDSSVYYKTQLEARVIHTFSDLTLAAVGKVGVIDDESGKGLPESKYFFGGGSYSNRAYGYRELGVILSPTQDTINGASSMANLSLEADYPIFGDLYGAVFTDNTMLTEQAYDFKGEIISTAGMGVRYMTPIGPFKLDIGFNVADPAQYGISFQIGQSF
ncbi:MAG TPA: outer membrane protein assembly factor [Epsilonproteobacteria bacterium]|nr:outer membrane protein assembly factor [Campylobacterota bacterium]